MTFKLNNLKSNPGSTRGKIRLGRGIGSGKGKTGGRGGKGQTARSGVAINGFEGGQTPIHRRLPKRGFKNFTRKYFEVVNVSDLQKAVESKKLDLASQINAESLFCAGLIRNNQDGVKLLGDGKISIKIDILVNKVSDSAIKAVEKAGGKVSLVPTKSAEAKSAAKSKKKA